MLRKVLSRLRELGAHENNVLIVSAVGVGVLAGLGAVVLEQTLRVFGEVFLGAEEPTTTSILRVLIAPAVGGLLAGPLIFRISLEAKGHGVPEVMEAVNLRGGRIRGRVAVIKTIASALTIGSGGSAGREGPIVQIGSALGSRVGSLFRMSEQRMRVLVACGAAGGIAAAFNAPLAGVFFALEVILQRFTTRGFATVVVSAVTASVVWRARFGNAPVLDVPAFGLRNPVELLFYAGLGLLAGVVAVAFTRTLYWTEDRFEALPVLDDVKPALGGLLLGGVGVASIVLVDAPIVYGSGLLGIDLALNNELVWWAMLALIAAKLLATSLTLGSGASGGVFSPALFMGAMLGGAIGQGVHAILPTATTEPGAYALVGMAAVFSGAAQAPISAILIVFEMTNDFRIIVPLMLSCIVATAVYTGIQRDSIYEVKIRRKGVSLTGGRERHLLERTPVARAIIEDVTAIQLPADLEAVHDRLHEEESEWLICVDGQGRFLGMLSLDRVEEARAGEGPVVLEELVDEDILPVIPTESLDDAFRKIALRDLRVLPVIDDLASRDVIGAVTRDSLTSAYWAALGEATRIREGQEGESD